MRKLKWGVLGAGGIADRRTIPGMMLSENAELVAVMEINADFAESLRAKYSAKRAYTDEDSLLADPEVEAVYIASPVVCHARQCEKAIAAGKHILVEKPLGMTAGESAAICAKAKEKGILMATGLMMRYNTYHQAIRDMIAEGKLGKIVSCHAQFTCWYPDMENCWRQNKKLAGGGAMTDMGIHCLDLLEYLTGSEIVRVAGMKDTMTFSYDVEDACSALFKLSCGAFGTVDANFNIPDDAAKCRLEIYGTAGSVRAEGSLGQVDGGDVLVTFSDPTLGYSAMQDRSASNDQKLSGAEANLYEREITSFGESVLNGRPIEVPAEAAAHVQKVIEAIYESSDTGKYIEL